MFGTYHMIALGLFAAFAVVDLPAGESDQSRPVEASGEPPTLCSLTYPKARCRGSPGVGVAPPSLAVPVGAGLAR